MKKVYEHDKLSLNWYDVWEKKKIFSPDYNKSKSYCITIPPPNITGKLHMGHAFQCTLMDILIRYYRMNDFCTLWKMGTDHAGIATQILIERHIKENDLNKKIKYAHKWKKIAIKNIKAQLKLHGCSLNWNTSRFTLDKHFSYAVKSAFIKLYKDGLIYKSKKLVNWDTYLQTAISDLETNYIEENTKLYYIKYKVHLTNEYITIATTRPETIFADVAIAINPDDTRYNHLRNKTVVIPIINKIIPIIFDTMVDISFGSGCLKITPAHDFNDFEIGKKHNLSIINILRKNGKLNNNVPIKYRNLTVNEARNLISDDLLKLKLIEKIEKYKSKIPKGDRSNSTIEPFLTEQWYVNTRILILPVKKALEKNNLKITPDKWKKVFFNWINNIKDWCISRQIWWGHRLPVWYDDNGNEYVGQNEKLIRINYNIKNNIPLNRTNDVLDTWFSSALWPFASLGWPNNTIEYRKFYPTNTLITGFDIIFFWAIRMMMFGLKFTKKLPFKEIYIHGLIQDSLGNKMSKTKGNVIDPSDIINGITFNNLLKKQVSNLLNKGLSVQIEKNIKRQFPNGISAFGIDAVRLTFTSFATDSTSIKINLEKFKKYRNFCNKIWNAAKFINENINPISEKLNKNSINNIWITSLWQKVKINIQHHIENRNFQLVNESIYNFFWNDFCSFYLETVKIFSINNKYSGFTRNVIINLFNEILKILHPIIPFITEEINYIINNKDDSLAKSNYPSIYNNKINYKVENDIEFLKEILTKIRSAKIENKNNIIYITYYMTNYRNIYFLESVKNIIIQFLKVKKLYISYKLSGKKININNEFIFYFK